MGAPLFRADGSATHTSNGYTILASINGPIEVQRRDEIAEEAALEVHIRPASGVGGMVKSSLQLELNS
jgi:exosome complex component RRP46